jgi:hypothetical protein
MKVPGLVTVCIAMVTLASAQIAPDARWAGEVQCQIDATGGAYERHETQSWTLTGEAPRIEGAMRLWPAMWQASGRGSASVNARRPGGAQWTSEVPPRATVNDIFIRASDNKLVFRQWLPKLEAPGALRIALGMALPITEWDYGWIVDSPTLTTVTGMRLDGSGGLPAQISEPGSPAPRMECRWNFRRQDANAPSGTPVLTASSGAGPVSRSPDAPTTGLQAPGQPKNSPLTPIAKVTNVKGEDLGQGIVRVSWTPVNGASEYKITGTGLAPQGVTVAATESRTSLGKIPAGPGSWTVTAVNAQGYADPANGTGVSAVVRILPQHAPVYLSKNNGAGGAHFTMLHYATACGICVPGAKFSAVMKALGISATTLVASGGWRNKGDGNGDILLWEDVEEARYTNLTEFAGERVSRCFAAEDGSGRLICYANTSDHGLTLIIRQVPFTWFLSFDGPPSTQSEVFGMASETDVDSSYRLALTSHFDSEGSKFAPHTCIACHGGQFDRATGKITGATLLPIDPARITARDGNFNHVNGAVMGSSPAPSVARFLTGLYGGNPPGAPAPKAPGGYSAGGGYQTAPASPAAPSTAGSANSDYVPAGWVSQSSLYRNVVRPYCIACHMNTPTNVDLTTSAGFMQFKSQILISVCQAHSMPHSEVQFKEFWTRDTGTVYLPGYLATILGGEECR